MVYHMTSRRSLHLETKEAKTNGKLKRDASNGYDKVQRRHNLDVLDMQIIDELLADATISSTAIASKYNVPLSTVQRRRTTLEALSTVTHEYSLNPINFGFRPVEFWVLVQKGRAEELAQNIFNKFENVLNVSIHINAISNINVFAYVSDSQQLYDMIESIKSLPFAEDVEFAEIVKVIATRQVNFFKIHI
jgi:DNA-binding Lrp family transcriptional regulator